MLSRFRLLLILSLAGLLAVACEARQAPTTSPVQTWTPEPTAPPKVNSVTFFAKDSSFLGADSVPAGLTEFTLRNEGQDAHQLMLVQIPDGRTIADFVLAVESDAARLPDWIVAYGGPNATPPGQQTATIVDLVPGQYLALSLLPDAQGVPHLARGMYRPLTVTEGGKAAEPPSDVAIDLAEFEFRLFASIPAGDHRLRVINAGTVPHEAMLVRLEGDATAQEYAAALIAGDDAPGAPAGGTTALSPTNRSIFSATFEPGRYALLCTLVDTDGKRHYEKGMLLELTIGQ